MGEQRDLMDADAIAKIKEIAEGEIAMLCTFDGARVRSRPMATQAIDDDGTVWFMSKAGSGKNQEIAENARVHLVYARPGSSEYMSVDGVATVLRDQQKIDEVWTRWAKAWFTEGKHDPSITLIAVRPSGGEYWDTKHNKVVSLAKIAIGALTGTQMDDGVAGRLKV